MYGIPLIFVDFSETVCRNCSMDWIKKIKSARANGATLAEIGAAIGLAASTVSDIESGRTKQPKGMAAVRLAGLNPKALGRAQTPHRINTPEAVERALHVPRAVPEHAQDVEAEKQIEPVEPGELDMMEPDIDTTDYDPDIDRIGPLEEVA